MAQCFSIYRDYDRFMFNNMFETYKDKIIIPEQSKDADMYFYIQDTGVYLFVDDMRNSENIINQKLDDVTDIHSYYRGYEVDFKAYCISGKIWDIFKVL